MNPGVDVHRTGALPQARMSSVAASRTSAADSAPPITSTRRMAAGGLKKCRPMTRSGPGMPAAMAVMSRLEVFVARTASAGWEAATRVKSARLVSRSSRTASTTSPHGGSPATDSTGVMRSTISSSCAELIRPLASCRCRLAMMRATASSTAPVTASTRATGWPAVAATWAMPEPMAPAPITATAESLDSVGM